MQTTSTIIEKNKAEELRVALKRYRGHDYVDIRTYVEPYVDEGEGRVPTRKGVTLAVTKLPELIAALQKAEDTAVETGALQKGLKGMRMKDAAEK